MKHVFPLILWLLADSAQATVNVFVTDSNGKAAIQYECTAGEVVRSFALNVSVDQGQIIGVSNYFRGPCTVGAQGYGIFPAAFRDHITVSSGTNANWDVVGYTPLAVVADDADTLAGLNSSGVTLELGALWDTTNPATVPPASGMLCVLEISQAAQVTVTTNAVRNGVVSAATGATMPAVFTGATVDPNGTTTILVRTTGSDPQPYGSMLAFTATVSGGATTPTGNVVFQDGATPLATVPLSGNSAVWTTQTGLTVVGSPHSIKAHYQGDGTHSPSESVAVSQTITAAGTTTTLDSSVNPSMETSNVTFTATVSSGAGTPTGDVVFKVNTVPFSTNALLSGIAIAATATLPLGTNAVMAEYAAQANWLGSSDSLEQVVKNALVYSQTNRILSMVNNPDGTFTLTLVGTPQADYYIVASADLAMAMSNWTALTASTNTAPTPDGQWPFTVTNDAPTKFYRLKAVSPAP
jgi:hypothetical protein